MLAPKVTVVLFPAPPPSSAPSLRPLTGDPNRDSIGDQDRLSSSSSQVNDLSQKPQDKSSLQPEQSVVTMGPDGCAHVSLTRIRAASSPPMPRRASTAEKDRKTSSGSVAPVGTYYVVQFLANALESIFRAIEHSAGVRREFP